MTDSDPESDFEFEQSQAENAVLLETYLKA